MQSFGLTEPPHYALPLLLASLPRPRRSATQYSRSSQHHLRTTRDTTTCFTLEECPLTFDLEDEINPSARCLTHRSHIYKLSLPWTGHSMLIHISYEQETACTQISPLIPTQLLQSPYNDLTALIRQPPRPYVPRSFPSSPEGSNSIFFLKSMI